jgi:hypothetical protein
MNEHVQATSGRLAAILVIPLYSFVTESYTVPGIKVAFSP